MMAERQKIRLSALRTPWSQRGDLILQVGEQDDPPPEQAAVTLCVRPTDCGKAVSALRISGPVDHLEPLRPLLPSAVCRTEPAWSIAADDVDGADILSQLTDKILSVHLAGARPLSRWRSRFLAVLRGPAGCLPSGLGTGHVAQAGIEVQEHLYWLPGLADVVQAPTPQQPGLFTTVWTGLPPVLSLTRQAETWHLPVTHLMLHAAPGGLFILEWGMGEEGWPTDADSDQPFWRQLAGLDMARRSDPEPRTLAELLDLNAALRPLHTALEMSPAVRYGHCLRLGEDILYEMSMGAAVGQEGPWRALAGLMLAPWGLTADQVALQHDERARVVSAVVPMGPPPAPELTPEWQAVLGRFSGADPFGTGPAYSPHWSAQELASSLYDRFATFGTRYMLTDHSLTMVGHGAFAADLGVGHLAGLYRRLYLVALLRRAAAHAIRADLARLPDPTGAAAIARAWRPFLLTLGFGPVTGQMQGSELFARMLAATGADKQLSEAVGWMDRACRE